MATFSPPAGTWTPLQTDLSKYRVDQQNTSGQATANMNVPQMLTLTGADMQTVPDEVYQIINLIALGYASGTSPNIEPLHFWAAASLLRTWLTSLTNRAAPNAA